MKNNKILGILIAMLLMPATLKVSAMSGNTNNQNEKNFFNFPVNEEVSEFCFSEDHEFNLTFEDLIKRTVRDNVIGEDLRKCYYYIKKANFNEDSIIDEFIEKFKEYNRKYFENNLKHFKEKNLYLNLNYYERLINLIYEKTLRALVLLIKLYPTGSIKAKMEAISKHSDYLTEKIINNNIKRTIRNDVKEKEKRFSEMEELNESIFSLYFGPVLEIFHKEGL